MSDPRLIFQLSDLHFPDDGVQLYDCIDCDARLQRVLDVVEGADRRPELILVTGDLADHGDASSYRRVRAALEGAAERLGAQLVVIPGNHDDNDTFAREMLDRATGGHELDQYKEIDGLRVIALDSTSPGEHHGSLTDAQLQRLADTLKTPAPHGTILALHHPPMRSPLVVMQRLDMQLREPERLADVVRGTDVRMVLCGHDHHCSAATLGGVTVWATAAVAYALDPLVPGFRLRGTRDGGFTLVEVHEDTVVTTNIPVPEPDVPLVLDADVEAQLAEYQQAP